MIETHPYYHPYGTQPHHFVQPFPHPHGHHHHHGHTIHITMFVHSEDITKTTWMWHISNHGGELVKSSTKIHKIFVECIEDAGSHGKIEVLSESEDISNTSSAWHINRHGELVKKSLHIHASFTECISDLRGHGSYAPLVF